MSRDECGTESNDTLKLCFGFLVFVLTFIGNAFVYSFEAKLTARSEVK